MAADSVRPGRLPPGISDRGAHEVLAVASRALVLEQVRASPDGVDTATLARGTGLHPNTVRFHLQILAEAGLVTVSAEAAGKPGRPRLRFTPARIEPPPPGAAPDQDGYAMLAEALVRQLASSPGNPGDTAQAAGRRWNPAGTWDDEAGPVPSDEEVLGRIAELFHQLGFAPEPVRDRDGWRILLHRCPFHALAQQHPEIVCRLHLGLLQGALDRLGCPAQSVRLQPFLAPDLCVAFVPLAEVRTRS